MKYCKIETAANLLSEYFESKGKKIETIEYKLIVKRYDEAFAIAQSYNKMDREFMLKNNKNIDVIKHYKCMLNQMMKNFLKKLLKWLEQQKMKN